MFCCTHCGKKFRLDDALYICDLPPHARSIMLRDGWKLHTLVTTDGRPHCKKCGHVAESETERVCERRPKNNYWTEREAIAAGDVHPVRCVHGQPRNVFCEICDG